MLGAIATAPHRYSSSALSPNSAVAASSDSHWMVRSTGFQQVRVRWRICYSPGSYSRTCPTPGLGWRRCRQRWLLIRPRNGRHPHQRPAFRSYSELARGVVASTGGRLCAGPRLSARGAQACVDRFSSKTTVQSDSARSIVRNSTNPPRSVARNLALLRYRAASCGGSALRGKPTRWS
jgi:hypothetical protein